MEHRPLTEEHVGKTLDLRELVAYHEGSIVSREILKTEKGTVTVFAFDRGQGLSEHSAPFDAMVQVLDGTAAITISGVSHIVKAGETIIMPANRPHALHAETPFKMLLTMIRG